MNDKIVTLNDYRVPAAATRDVRHEPPLSDEEIFKMLRQIKEGCRAINATVATATDDLMGMRERLAQIEKRYIQSKRNAT